jgi:predicted GNAT family N-acyltransferase
MNLDIHVAKNKEEIEKCLIIRKEVFIEGQDVPSDREVDGLDNVAEHVIVYYESKPVGTARIRYPKRMYMKLERIAILESMRGNGLGKKLMEFLVTYAKEKKVEEVVMHAQYYLLQFYKKFGFKERGNTFDDAGIKHIEMYLEV